jgi:murein DD-endopeptidase MepM/ murein hydrolase activator NlpD
VDLQQQRAGRPFAFLLLAGDAPEASVEPVLRAATLVFCTDPQRAKLLKKKKIPVFLLTPKNHGKISVEACVRLAVLRKNPPYGWTHRVAKWGLPFVLALCAAPFFFPGRLSPELSHFRDVRADIAKYAQTPRLTYLLEDPEQFFQASRYALGRYTAQVATQEQVFAYQKETLEKNPGLSNPPPAGAVVEFFPPEHLHNPRRSIDAPAWDFFTRIFTDTVAYITEGYHETETRAQRKHPAIDIATRRGARILAPFSGTAWVREGERSGRYLALVGGRDVLVFMHCDQVFYLDGQEVVAGDPIATVGMTGHTTGPHVHLVAGIVDPKGESSVGPVKYRVVNPFEWYGEFRGNQAVLHTEQK